MHKRTEEVIGVCGFVPCLDRFEQLCDFQQPTVSASAASMATTEFGLFYAISPTYQGKGFGTEAAQAMATYAFEYLHVKRVIATTTHDNMDFVR